MSEELDIKALDYLSDSRDENPEMLQAMGIDHDDRKAWDYAQKNPKDPRSKEIKSIVTGKIADNNETLNEQGISYLERMDIKTTIPNDVNLQVKYLKDRGYTTKTDSADGKLRVRRPNQVRWRLIEEDSVIPNSFGEFVADTVDVLPEIGEAAAGGLKVAGAATGFAPAAMVGAGISGGVELGRQALGLMRGTRDELDVREVGKQALWGGVPSGLMGMLKNTPKGLTSTAIKEAEGLITTARSSGDKAGVKAGKDLLKEATKTAEDVIKERSKKEFSIFGKVFRKAGQHGPADVIDQTAQIAADAERLGAVATPGMKSASKGIQEMEETFTKYPSSSGFAGGDIRKQVTENIEAVQRKAGEIVSGTGVSKVGSAAEVENAITQTIDDALEPAVQTYEKYNKNLATLPADMGSLKAMLKEMAADYGSGPTGKIVKQYVRRVGEITDYRKLQILKTELTRALKNITDPDLRYVSGRVLSGLRQARLDTVRNGAYNLYKKEVTNVNQLFKEMSENPDLFTKAHLDEFEGLIGKLGIDIQDAINTWPGVSKQITADFKTADNIYAETFQAVDDIFGKKGKEGLAGKADAFFENFEGERIVDKLWDAKNPAGILRIKKFSPEAFESLKNAKLAELTKKVTTDGNVDPAKLRLHTKNMSYEVKRLLFTSEAGGIVDEAKLLDLDAMGRYLSNIPKSISNYSNTAKQALNFKDMIGAAPEIAGSYFKKVRYNAAQGGLASHGLVYGGTQVAAPYIEDVASPYTKPYEQKAWNMLTREIPGVKKAKGQFDEDLGRSIVDRLAKAGYPNLGAGLASVASAGMEMTAPEQAWEVPLTAMPFFGPLSKGRKGTNVFDLFKDKIPEDAAPGLVDKISNLRSKGIVDGIYKDLETLHPGKDGFSKEQKGLVSKLIERVREAYDKNFIDDDEFKTLIDTFGSNTENSLDKITKRRVDLESKLPSEKMNKVMKHMDEDWDRIKSGRPDTRAYPDNTFELGADIQRGGKDPFSWGMLSPKNKGQEKDLKEFLARPGRLDLEIKTRSDLVAHDDFMENLKSKDFVEFVVNDFGIDGNKGGASYKRILEAYKKLENKGVKVNIHFEKSLDDIEKKRLRDDGVKFTSQMGKVKKPLGLVDSIKTKKDPETADE